MVAFEGRILSTSYFDGAYEGPQIIAKLSLIVCFNRWREFLSIKAEFFGTFIMKFSIKDIFSKCDQIRRKLRI